MYIKIISITNYIMFFVLELALKLPLQPQTFILNIMGFHDKRDQNITYE